jgi:hypothetical protein
LSPAVTVGQGSNKKKRRSVLLCSLNSTHNNHIFPINSLLLLKLIHLKQINKNIIRWGCVLPLKVDRYNSLPSSFDAHRKTVSYWRHEMFPCPSGCAGTSTHTRLLGYASSPGMAPSTATETF